MAAERTPSRSTPGRPILDELAGDAQSDQPVSCVSSKDRVALAGPGYPADKVLGAGRSYASAVTALLECEALRAALGETYV